MVQAHEDFWLDEAGNEINTRGSTDRKHKHLVRTFFFF